MTHQLVDCFFSAINTSVLATSFSIAEKGLLAFVGLGVTSSRGLHLHLRTELAKYCHVPRNSRHMEFELSRKPRERDERGHVIRPGRNGPGLPMTASQRGCAGIDPRPGRAARGSGSWWLVTINDGSPPLRIGQMRFKPAIGGGSVPRYQIAEGRFAQRTTGRQVKPSARLRWPGAGTVAKGAERREDP